jgi:multidrug efflux pump subunit AcrB
MPRSVALFLAASLAACRSCGPSGEPAACTVSEPPVIALISVPTPGMSATESEQLIALPLEAAVAELDAVVGVQSLSRAGLVTLRVELSQAQAFVELRGRVNAVELPEESEAPLLLVTGIPQEIAIANDRLGAVELRALLDRALIPKWRQLPGVVKVSACGGDLRELHVRVPTSRMAAHGLRAEDIVSATKGAVTDLGAAVVSSAGGTVVRLSDVATIETAAVPDPCQCLNGAVCAHIEGAAVLPSMLEVPPGTRIVESPPALAAVMTHASRDVLRASARNAADWLSSEPGVRDVAVLGDDSAPEIDVRHHENCPASPAVLAATVRWAQAGNLVGANPDGLPIRVFIGDEAHDAAALTHLPVALPDGKLVPLSFCAELILSASPHALLRFNNRPALALRVRLDEPARAAGVRAAASRSIELPAGAVFQWLDVRDLLLQRRSNPESSPPGIWP